MELKGGYVEELTIDMSSGDARPVGETVISLTPPLPLVGVSVVMERERQQNDSLADGYHRHE